VLPVEVHDAPPAIALLDVRHRERGDLGPPQGAAQEHGDYGAVAGALQPCASFLAVYIFESAPLTPIFSPRLFYDELMKSNKVLPIEIGWRFDILERMGRVRLNELEDFHKQGEKTFKAAMSAWQGEVKEFESKYGDADGDHLISQREEIESLLDRSQSFEIVGLYTFLERFLNLVVEHLRAGGANIPVPAQTGFKIHQIRNHLAQEAKIDMNRKPFDWKAIEILQEIRNCIVHADGWITDDFASRLGKVGMKVNADTPLKLPTSYFENALKLVGETYKTVYTRCSEKFGYAKHNEVWLRPTRKFTSDELRTILQEATDSGVAAREETTKRLLKLAKKRRRTEEDSCGWVWLTIDPKLLKHIHKLNIPSVSTSYKAETIVEDFNLYLDDVRDYQRMSATSDGMKAAAAVLKKHGINSHQQSLAD
jgi:hypothetical protein